MPAGISSDIVCNVVVLARRFDVKEGETDPDSGSNASDDRMRDVLEDTPDDPVRREFVEFVRGLNIDEQVVLVALAWVGRGTYDKSEWKEAIETARNEHNNRTAQYLLTLPLLADYLEEGLAAFDENCESFEMGRM